MTKLWTNQFEKKKIFGDIFNSMLFLQSGKAFFGYKTFINAFSELILAKKKG